MALKSFLNVVALSYPEPPVRVGLLNESHQVRPLQNNLQSKINFCQGFQSLRHIVLIVVILVVEIYDFFKQIILRYFVAGS